MTAAESSTNKKLPVAVALCVVAAAVAVVVLHRSRKPDLLQKAVQMHQRGGEVMAKLVEDLLPGGGRILLVTPALDSVSDPDHRTWYEGMFATFEQRLPSSFTVAGRETLRIAPVRTDPGAPYGPLTTAFLRKALASCGGADAIVSFADAPRGRDSTGLPHMICFCTSGDALPSAMAQGLVVSAVAPKHSPSPVSAMGGDWFDIMYEVVTPATVEAWAAP